MNAHLSVPRTLKDAGAYESKRAHPSYTQHSPLAPRETRPHPYRRKIRGNHGTTAPAAEVILERGFQRALERGLLRDRCPGSERWGPLCHRSILRCRPALPLPASMFNDRRHGATRRPHAIQAGWPWLSLAGARRGKDSACFQFLGHEVADSPGRLTKVYLRLQIFSLSSRIYRG